MSVQPATSPTSASPAEALVLVQRSGGVATITMNRPRQYNAISMEMLDELQAAFAIIGADSGVRVVVLGGAGPAFSGGHDLKQMMANRTDAFIGALFAKCSKLMITMQQLPQPVIARVHGTATAAGCQVVAGCDMAVAAADARFATSGVNFGLFCATPGVPLSRNVSRKRAFEMLFTGEFIDAATALSWGLVNRVVPAEELDAEVQRLVAAVMAKPPAVIAEGKRLFYAQLEADLPAAYRMASASITSNMLGPDAGEGVGAFLEKRTPRWPGVGSGQG